MSRHIVSHHTLIRILPAFVLFASLMMNGGAAKSSELVSLPAAHMNCRIGPVSQTLGNGLWLVYTCEDRQTLVIDAAPTNAAAPFTFIVSPTVHGHRVTVDGAMTSQTWAAYGHLQRMSEVAIMALVAMAAHHESLEEPDYRRANAIQHTPR